MYSTKYLVNFVESIFFTGNLCVCFMQILCLHGIADGWASTKSPGSMESRLVSYESGGGRSLFYLLTPT